MREQNVFFAAVTRTNVNCALVFEVLYRLCDVFKSYFGVIDEATIRNNFVLLYELLDGL